VRLFVVVLVHLDVFAGAQAAHEPILEMLAALTRFWVELGHLESPLQLCARCSPGDLATYWTRDLKEHFVATPAE